MSEILRGTADYLVAVDETDCLGRLKPSAWLQYMQDLAASHAQAIGVGFHAMFERGLVWVLTRVSLRVARAPAIGERLRAETYPKIPGRVTCVRDFYFYDGQGALAAAASTVWCMIDYRTRRICRAAEYFPYPEEAFRSDDAPVDLPRAIAVPADAAEIYADRVRFAEIDRNRHLNNARYGDMLLNAFPEGALLSEEIAGFDLHFERELRLGARFAVSAARRETEYYVKTEDGDGTVFCARCALRPWEGGIR